MYNISFVHCASHSSATLTHHANKVQCVAWHPLEAAVLASGGYDESVCVLDARAPKAVARLACSGVPQLPFVGSSSDLNLRSPSDLNSGI